MHTQFDMTGARFETALTVEERGDAVLFRTTMSPGKEVPLHQHIDPEGFYVLSGAIEVFLLYPKPAWHRVCAGESLLVPNGAKHALRTYSSVGADLMILTNLRLAEYFRRVGRPTQGHAQVQPPTPDEIEHMLAISDEFGYWVASPAESAAITGV